MRHMTVCVLSVLLGILVLFPPVFSHSSISSSADEFHYTNWPLARMDAQNSAFTTASLPNNMEFSEVLPIHSLHAPIVANDYYYLVNNETGEIHCHEIETKELMWKKLYSTFKDDDYEYELRLGNILAYSLITKQILLLETIEGDWESKKDFASRFYVLDPINGEEIWHLDVEGYYANSIIVEGAYAYVKFIEISRDKYDSYSSNRHCVYKIDLQLREVVWSLSNILGGEPFWSPSYVAVHEKYIVTTSNNVNGTDSGYHCFSSPPCYITIIDKNRGGFPHTLELEAYSICTPIVQKDEIFVVVNKVFGSAGTLMYLLHLGITNNQLNIKDEYQLSHKLVPYLIVANMAVYDNALYFLDYSGFLLCFSIDEDKILWKKQVGEKSWVGPLFCNDEYVVVCTSYKNHGVDHQDVIVLQYFDPRTGKELFKNISPFEIETTTNRLRIAQTPNELICTDNHIWAGCWGKIALFTPAVPISLQVEPNHIFRSCGEEENKNIICPLQVISTGRIQGSILCPDDWVILQTKVITESLSSINVTLQPKKLSIGTHHSSVIFDSNVGKIEIPITLVIEKNPRLKVTPLHIEKEIWQGESIAETYLTITNTGGQTLEGTLSCAEDWIELSTSHFQGNNYQVAISFRTIQDQIGIHTSTLHVQSNGGKADISMQLKVKEKPKLEVEPKDIKDQLAIGTHSFHTLHLSNVGGEGLKGIISSDQEWLTPHLSHYNDDTKTLTLTLNARYLQAGIYHGTLTFTGNDQVIVVPVTLECIVWITFRIGSTTVEVNKVKETIEAAPYLFQKRSYVPVRKLVESLPVVNYLKNTEIVWNPEEQKVTLLLGEELTIELWVDSPIARVNGKETPIDPDNLNITPQIRSGRTFLPLRFISETLGYTVEWIGSTQTIHVKYIVQEE